VTSLYYVIKILLLLLQNQEGLPPNIKNTIRFIAVLLQPISYTVLTLILFIGSYFIVNNLYKPQFSSEKLASLLHFKSNSKSPNNIILAFENEPFMKMRR
jgi:hypothetical protein